MNSAGSRASERVAHEGTQQRDSGRIPVSDWASAIIVRELDSTQPFSVALLKGTGVIILS